MWIGSGNTHYVTYEPHRNIWLILDSVLIFIFTLYFCCIFRYFLHRMPLQFLHWHFHTLLQIIIQILQVIITQMEHILCLLILYVMLPMYLFPKIYFNAVFQYLKCQFMVDFSLNTYYLGSEVMNTSRNPLSLFRKECWYTMRVWNVL